MKTRVEIISSRNWSKDQLDWWTSQGVDLRICSLISIRFLESKDIFPLEESLILFTSKNSVRALESSGEIEQLRSLKEKTFLAIEPSTAKKLEDLGLDVKITAPNAKALAEKIIATFSPQPIRYFCSPDRLPDLPRILSQADFQVNEIHVYKTEYNLKKIDWNASKGMLFLSPSAVRSYFQMNEWPNDKQAFAIGPKTSEELVKYGVEPIFMAPYPNKEGLLSIVQSSINIKNYES